MLAKPVSNDCISGNPEFLASSCNGQKRKEMTKFLKCIIVQHLKPYSSHIFDLTVPDRNIVDFIKNPLQKKK